MKTTLKIPRRQGRARPLRIALAAGAFAVVLVIAIAWFCSLRSASVTSETLPHDEVRQIVRMASKERWKLVRFAFTKRESKLMRRVALARIQSVEANSGSHGKAIVICRTAFEPDSEVFMTFKNEGKDGWKFEKLISAVSQGERWVIKMY